MEDHERVGDAESSSTEHAAGRAIGRTTGHMPVLAGHAQYLIESAARAPSVHNSQPWRFHVGADCVELWCDPRRRTWSDAGGREMLISCGAALFGLRLAVRSLGYEPEVSLLPDPARLRLLASVRAGHAAPPNALETRMLDAVPHRHTHRGPFEPGPPLPAGLLAGLQNDALVEGAELALVRSGLAYERLASLAAAAARRGDIDPRSRATIRRWTRTAADRRRNGLADDARDGIPAVALAASPAASQQPGRLRQRDFDLGRHLGLLPVGGAPPVATAILLTRDDRRADWLRAGQSLYRLLLHAASVWVFASLYTQPVEDPVTRTLIRTQLGLHGYPQVVLQFGHARSAAATPRRGPSELTC